MAAYVAAGAVLAVNLTKLFARFLSGTLSGAQLLSLMRRQARACVAAIEVSENPVSGPLVERVIQEAAVEGLTFGESSIPAAPAPGRFPDLPVSEHGLESARQIVNDLRSSLDDVKLRITRLPEDIYRRVVLSAVDQVTGGVSPRAAQLAAWRDLMGRGLTGFVDARGARWNLATYVEVAVRAATQRAYLASSVERMGAMGVEFFLVPPHAAPCPMCAPWQGAVLSARGPGMYRVNGVDVLVAATIEQAREAGLFHPNCLDVLTAFLPGHTVQHPVPEVSQAEKDAYNATQHQRALERAVRAAKSELVSAATPQARSAARANVRRAVANLQAFTQANGLGRYPHREQINLGHKM